MCGTGLSNGINGILLFAVDKHEKLIIERAENVKITP